jgi:hypothetical protein
LAPKPVYIFAQTGGQAGSSATVRVAAWDACGDPMYDLSGAEVSVWADNPDRAAASNAVTVGTPNGAGVATVQNIDSTIRAAVVAAEVDTVLSDDNPSGKGNTTVSTVPYLLGGDFNNTGISNDNGINSIITRGGTEDPSTDTTQANAAMRLRAPSNGELVSSPYVIPDDSQPAVPTERHIVCATTVGDGDVVNLAVSGTASLAGTTLMVYGGGQWGINTVMMIALSINTSVGGGSFDVPPTGMGGILTQAAQQTIDFNHGLLMFLADPIDRARDTIIQFRVRRNTP